MFRSAGVVLVAVLLIAAPVAGSLLLAHRLARDTEFERVEALARTLLARTDTIAAQSEAAVLRLDAARGHAPCSPANLALMREIDVGSSYLQAVGHVANGRLLCSSLGHHGAGIPIGPVQSVSPRGNGLRVNVRLPMAPDQGMLVSERRGSAVVIHPRLATDMAGASKELSAGVVHLSRRAPVVSRGELRPGWLRRAPQAGGQAARFVDGDRVVALLRPAGQDYVTYAAVPRTALDERAAALAWRLGPAGGVLGALLWLAMHWQVRRLRSLPAVMRAALANGEFFLEYQPIVELETGQWVGAEALVRWQRPDGSRVQPDAFIPVAEGSDLICRITACVLDIAGREAPPLLARRPDFRLSFNVSAADLASRHTVRRLGELLARPGFAPHNIEVEATERGLLDADATRCILGDIRALGVRVAIDDFGTGYSGLSYLGTFELDTLKIDKAFVDTIGTDAPTRNVAVHIIEMARELGLEMVAEGVEQAGQAAFLRRSGVQRAQGWLFARPMPMDELLARLDEQDAMHRDCGAAEAGVEPPPV